MPTAVSPEWGHTSSKYDTLLKDKVHLFANRTQALAVLGTSGEAVTLLGPFYDEGGCRDEQNSED